ncbi:hypothetical protein AGMMS49995_10890 [Endomicrobiia bacterium]|nr:hypothetical protein AGMMS49995_10890 [Endomicrobiia bacterium]
MNALEIVQQASKTLGIENIKTIQDQINTNTQRLTGALNRALEEVQKSNDWQELISPAHFITNPSADNPSYIDGIDMKGYIFDSMLPSFDYFVSEYLYDNTIKRRINSIRPDGYEYDKVFKMNISFPSFTLIQNFLCFMPEIPKNHVISFFFKSKYAVYDQSDRQYKEYFTQDTDTTLLNSQLLLRGLLWKYKCEMGFDYAEAYRDYQTYLNKVRDQDSNRRHLGNHYSLEGIPISIVRNELGEII